MIMTIPAFSRGMKPTLSHTEQGPEKNLYNEDVGTVKIDHHFNGDWSGYFRFTHNNAYVRTPDSLQYGTNSYNGPVNGVVELLQVASPRTTNEIRMGSSAMFSALVQSGRLQQPLKRSRAYCDPAPFVILSIAASSLAKRS